MAKSTEKSPEFYRDFYNKIKEEIDWEEERFWEFFQQAKKEEKIGDTLTQFFNGKWDSIFNLKSFIEKLEKQLQK